MTAELTPHPEGHTREGMDEWPSGPEKSGRISGILSPGISHEEIPGDGIPLHDRGESELKDAMTVRSWSFTEILQAVKSYIEYEKAFGHSECYVKDAVKKQAAGTGGGDPLDALGALRARVASCAACGLHKTRTNVVFGSGSAHAALMFVGEAPGEDEDLQGVPFVGRAGQLLTKIIEAMKLTREDVYIANILKCRPPHNRAPLPAEIEACSDNVKRQIELIRPKVICTLGKFASQTLLKTETPISALRGRFHDYNGIKVMPTFHPAYLLRNPPEKKTVWEDMKKIMKVL